MRQARFTVALLLVAAQLPAQARPQHRLDSLFIAHRHPLTFDGTSASGAGFELLLSAARRAQFVMVGESHNVREIPLFTAALFERLHTSAGFRYLGMENGPIATEMLAVGDARGSDARLTELANRYVNALQFRTDQELELMARAGRASSATTPPVWGLDNEYGALHLLEPILAGAPSPAARALAGRLTDSARVYERLIPAESRPRYLNRVLQADDVRALDSLYRGATPAVRRFVDGLVTAFEVYHVRREGPRGVYAGNVRREQLMRTQLMEHIRQAQRGGDSLPRAVLKFGQWHALRGVLNWGNVEPLGTFLGEVARSNGLESIHIWTGLLNPPGQFWSLDEARFADFHPIAAAGTHDGWWVVDLRAVRPFVAARLVPEPNDEMKKVVYGFDFALLIGGGRRATTARLTGVTGG